MRPTASSSAAAPETALPAPPSSHALALRRLVEDHAPELAPVGRRALAITGSAGRGDADASSDIDVWTIADAGGPPLGRLLDGVPVTVFREHEALALSLDHLAALDVEDAYVIEDRESLFSRAQALCRERGPAIRAYNLESSLLFVAKLIAMAERGTPTARAFALRKAAQRLAATLTYARGGPKAPKMRHLEQTLERERFAALRRVHGFDAVALDPSSLQDGALALPPLIDAFLHDEGVLRPRAEAPHVALRKLEHGHSDDGVLQLRTFLQRHVVDPIHHASGARDMVAHIERRAPPPLASFFLRLFAVSDAGLKELRESFAELLAHPAVDEDRVRRLWPSPGVVGRSFSNTSRG